MNKLLNILSGLTPCPDKIILHLINSGVFEHKELNECLKICNIHYEKLGNMDVADYIETLE